MDWFKILTEGVGLLGIIACLLAFQMKKRNAIMFMQLLGVALFGLQLALLKAWTGAILDAISFVRTFIFSKRADKEWAQHPFWLVFFIIVQLATGILTWESFISIFAILGTLLATFALWMKKPKYIRLICLFVGPCWIVYNSVIGAYTGVLNEVIAMTSIVIGIIRYDIKKKKD